MMMKKIAAAALMTSFAFAPAYAATTSETTGTPKGECKAVDKPGQQEIVDGKKDLETAALSSEKKTPHEINKEIIAEMTRGKSGTQDDAKKAASEQKSAAEINKEIVANTKETPSGAEVAKVGDAKPTENWFGCPPEKQKQ